MELTIFALYIAVVMISFSFIDRVCKKQIRYYNAVGALFVIPAIYLFIVMLWENMETAESAGEPPLSYHGDGADV